MDITRLPYKIAVLCYLYDEQGRVLLLERNKSPNKGLFSPIGGKLEMQRGESPTTCAAREIQEETGLVIPAADLHLAGIVSETAYQAETHWLMFLYDVRHPVELEPHEMDEGKLDWHEVDAVDRLPIPETDVKVIWPLRKQHRGGFFMVHIDCTEGDLRWTVEQSRPA
ncbi:MAG: NUDIX domain-containing protein [Phycisphaerales bacterium]|nr:NUDIX domain-containing protein [Phycisphaerales bacterium]